LVSKPRDASSALNSTTFSLAGFISRRGPTHDESGGGPDWLNM
jgi:hypothetical protein